MKKNCFVLFVFVTNLVIGVATRE